MVLTDPSACFIGRFLANLNAAVILRTPKAEERIGKALNRFRLRAKPPVRSTRVLWFAPTGAKSSERFRCRPERTSRRPAPGCPSRHSCRCLESYHRSCRQSSSATIPAENSAEPTRNPAPLFQLSLSPRAAPRTDWALRMGRRDSSDHLQVGVESAGGLDGLENGDYVAGGSAHVLQAVDQLIDLGAFGNFYPARRNFLGLHILLAHHGGLTLRKRFRLGDLNFGRDLDGESSVENGDRAEAN